MPGGPSCRVLLYAMAIASTIMSMAISIILLERAYLAHCPFLIVVYRKYRRYGEQCWKILVREGILTMLFILGSGFLCMIVLISTIIVESLRRLDAYMGHHTSADQQPNMRKPHKSSQLNSLLATTYYTDAPTTF
ncbi:hypothetical protein BDF22DRAFT_774130 [Syncephalis plumigaleata]|nr:hypothetical protein BDF22DRAFT_774130 [Syncephalis plumigaleata]